MKEFVAISLIESRQLALLHVGLGESAAFSYHVMELADDITSGRAIDPADYVPHTLKEFCHRQGRLKAAKTITIGVNIARALA